MKFYDVDLVDFEDRFAESFNEFGGFWLPWPVSAAHEFGDCYPLALVSQHIAKLAGLLNDPVRQGRLLAVLGP